MLRNPPITKGHFILPRAVRPEMKKYNPRSEVDHLSIYTDKEVVLLYNFDLIPSPFFYQKVMETCSSGYCFSLLNFRFHTFLHSSEMGLTSYRAC